VGGTYRVRNQDISQKAARRVVARIICNKLLENVCGYSDTARQTRNESKL
jgi:hypothetical protein